MTPFRPPRAPDFLVPRLPDVPGRPPRPPPQRRQGPRAPSSPLTRSAVLGRRAPPARPPTPYVLLLPSGLPTGPAESLGTEEVDGACGASGAARKTGSATAGLTAGPWCRSEGSPGPRASHTSEASGLRPRREAEAGRDAGGVGTDQAGGGGRGVFARAGSRRGPLRAIARALVECSVSVGQPQARGPGREQPLSYHARARAIRRPARQVLHLLSPFSLLIGDSVQPPRTSLRTTLNIR